MSGFRLITSAAYLGQELFAEFGKIPPAFLPVGNMRLYEAQVARLGPGSPVFLTIPETYTPGRHDLRRLDELGVSLLRVAEGLSLGESIAYAILSIDRPDGPVRILHGDTLIDDILPEGSDALAVHGLADDYAWAAVTVEDGRVMSIDSSPADTEHTSARPLACGYFSFASSLALVRSITRARGDFIVGIALYAGEHSVAAVEARNWYDFGHIQTYFRSRRAVTTARSFNTLSIDAYAVSKSSDDRHKIQAETEWLDRIPAKVRPFGTRLLDSGEQDGQAFYRTEYQYAPTLSELMVFSSIGRGSWKNIIRSCETFLCTSAACKGTGSADSAIRNLAIGKTTARLEQYAGAARLDLEAANICNGRPLPSLSRIAEDVAGAIDLSTGRPDNVMHGDFCFSNILYNSRSARISVIDPRGYVEAGAKSIFGDTRYDLAKLSHSVFGCYDHIIAGRYVADRSGEHRFDIVFDDCEHHGWLKQEFASLEIDGYRVGSAEIKAITISLFLSMLPLHADRPDRQVAFVANALRLYSEL